jgi:phospholipid transport system substrate-binding protein
MTFFDGHVLARRLFAGWVLAAVCAAAAGEVDTSNPYNLIQTSATAMLREIDANRAAYRQDPMLLYAVVDRILLPSFDVDYAARLVLGKNWRAATAEQRKRFIEAFYRSLLTNYSDALVEFTGDRLKVLPTKVAPGAQVATVRSEIKRNNGQKVPVNYTLRLTPQGWKVWDVVIEGISYVKSFREDFGAEIDQKGLDAVIQRLATQKGAPARKT